MTQKHYFILAGFIGALGVQLAGLEHGWHDALSPAFVGGVLVQIGTLFAAIYTDKPTSSADQFVKTGGK